MGARFRPWRQQIKQSLVTILVILVILAVAIVLIIVGYRFDWTGFNGSNKSGKTLWDWLQLLIIPIILAIGGFWLNQKHLCPPPLSQDVPTSWPGLPQPCELNERAKFQGIIDQFGIGYRNRRELPLS